MQRIVIFIIFIVMGIIMSRLFGLIGSEIFRFSDIYRSILKYLKKTEDK